MTRVWFEAYGVLNHNLKLQCKKFSRTRDIPNFPTQGWAGTAFCMRKRSETYAFSHILETLFLGPPACICLIVSNVVTSVKFNHLLAQLQSKCKIGRKWNDVVKKWQKHGSQKCCQCCEKKSYLNTFTICAHGKTESFVTCSRTLCGGTSNMKMSSAQIL